MKIVDNVIDKFADIVESLEDKPMHKGLAISLEVILGSLLFILGGGWLFIYDISTEDEDWTKSDSILYYSANMFFVVFFGALLQALILLGTGMSIAAVIAVCYYGWFIVLPLFLVFLGICTGRWIHMKKNGIT